MNVLETDLKEIKRIEKQFRRSKQEERKKEMFRGEIPPKDKNFFELTTGDRVFVQVSAATPVLEGKIRMSKVGDSYIVEHDEFGILTWDMMRPGLQITSRQPFLFAIDKPNHKMVFKTKKAMELHSISFLKTESNRTQMHLVEIVDRIKNMIEKYPEEFI